jgi:hypothetical protein
MKGISKVAVASAMVILGVAAAAASGAIPSASDGVINGCYQKPGLLANPGAVRVIDREKGQTCRSNEIAFQWSQQGPKGAPGSQGVAGPQGDAGPPGQPGPRGPSDAYSARRDDAVVLDCPPPSIGCFLPVLTLGLPAGNFAITAKTVLGTPAAIGFTCDLYLNEEQHDRSTAFSGERDGSRRRYATLALVATASLSAPGTARVECTGSPDLTAENTSIVAVKIAGLHEE